MAIKLQGTNSAAAPGLTNDGGDGVVVGTDSVDISIGGASKVKVDSSGRVLVGATTEGNVSADDLTVETAGHTGITLRSGTSNQGSIYFSDATSGAAEYAGWIRYDHSGNNLTLGTNETERIRILSGGEVAIGGSGYAGQPFSLQTSGVNVGWMESTGTTRAVMNFSDSNSTVGVGVGCIGNNHVFLKDSTEKVRIQGSGGISFNGDTAAANALDDYEEGTHTTALVGSGSLYSGANGLSYTKIGNVVTVSGQVRVNTGDAGDIQLTLPFSAGSNVNDDSHNFVGSLNTYNSSIHASSTAQGICTQIGAGTNHVSFMAAWHDSPWTALPTTADGYYRFTITYFTA